MYKLLNTFIHLFITENMTLYIANQLFNYFRCFNLKIQNNLLQKANLSSCNGMASGFIFFLVNERKATNENVHFSYFCSCGYC